MSHRVQPQFAISIPQFVADGTLDPDAFRAYLARAEALGFQSAWTGEQVLGTYFGMSGLDAAAVAGSPNDCVRGLDKVGAAGAQLILLNPLFGVGGAEG